MQNLAAIPGAFASSALPCRVADAVWRGTQLGGSSFCIVPSGFAALDKELPGGGWPTHSLTELLMPQAVLCEWRLLGPALPSFLASGGRVYLVAPPRQPHAGGLAQLGLGFDQLVWIHATAPVDCLWVTEQLIKSDPAGAVLSWLPEARPEQIRRLQIHAQSCGAPVFLFRPEATLSEASPAPLRVTVGLAQGWGLEVHIPKRRGASLHRSLHLEALPPNLAGAIAASVKLRQAPAVLSLQPSRKETTNVRALGRVVPPPLLRRLLSH